MSRTEAEVASTFESSGLRNFKRKQFKFISDFSDNKNLDSYGGNTLEENDQRNLSQTMFHQASSTSMEHFDEAFEKVIDNPSVLMPKVPLTQEAPGSIREQSILGRTLISTNNAAASLVEAPMSPSPTMYPVEVRGTDQPTLSSKNSINLPPVQDRSVLTVITASPFTVIYITNAQHATPGQMQDAVTYTCAHIKQYITDMFALADPYVALLFVTCQGTGFGINPTTIDYTISATFANQAIPMESDVDRFINMAVRRPHSSLLIANIKQLQDNPYADTQDVVYMLKQRSVLDIGLEPMVLKRTFTKELPAPTGAKTPAQLAALNIFIGIVFGLLVIFMEPRRNGSAITEDSSDKDKYPKHHSHRLPRHNQLDETRHMRMLSSFEGLEQSHRRAREDEIIEFDEKSNRYSTIFDVPDRYSVMEDDLFQRPFMSKQTFNY